jgi:GT2 family glycosyltransferase
MATFSIIIPVKPGGFVAALSPLHQLDPGPHAFEVLIAEGSSPSRQRNAAAREARGDLIYFLDDDSRVAADCLTTCARIMEDETVAVVGGPSLTPPDDTLLQQLFGCALASLLGAGAVRNRYRATGTARTTTEKELILCNLFMRRGVYLEAGGLDERLYPNEENELLDRIIAGGMRLVHSPALAIQRSQRRSLRLFMRQMFSYGRGRAQQTLISGSFSPVSFAPLFFLLYLTLLPFVKGLPLTLVPLTCYAGLVVLFSLFEAVRCGAFSRMFLILLYPVMHLSNGWGLLCGLLGGKHGRSRRNQDAPVTVRRVKAFDQSAW